ncbi:MAG: formylglycine-generating enzyme family protein [Lentisphaeria bacterium]|nr:formylglycine-generating enzyme family protein [Lentisphaeria bacterium]
MMGSPNGGDETQHQVTLTQDYYIGVFEMTQRQYELIYGSNPSVYKGDCRPVEQVSYNTIRGTGGTAGAGWPMYGHAVDEGSFLGKLRAKTGLVFDLPTEAQWEYACRAETVTALNTGRNLTSTGQDPAMDEAGRYEYNRDDGKGGYSPHTKVGSYLPNAWGLYDMHGNVYEWCLDWYGSYPSGAVTDPVGPQSGSARVQRGGSWDSYVGRAWNCRSASRGSYDPSRAYSDIGFRVVCLPPVVPRQ